MERMLREKIKTLVTGHTSWRQGVFLHKSPWSPAKGVFFSKSPLAAGGQSIFFAGTTQFAAQNVFV
jgi:hypothetical protein